MENTRSVYDFLGYRLQEIPEWIGLDYESAVEAMPHLYGVSFGDGNNGVSQMYPRYYVRTCEPYTLAAAAMVAQFNDGEGQYWASQAVEVDGEADYGIDATIYDPPEDDKDAWADDDDEEPNYSEESWSSVNGVWMICQVFPVDRNDLNSGKMVYDSLRDAFSEDTLTLVKDC